MKISQPEQEALTSIMTRISCEIREIEESYQLCVGDGDFRARIEYFHDAVRAFTSQQDDPHERERLTVELLAYDVSCLRYLQSMPLANFKPSAQRLSPRGALVVSRHTPGGSHSRPSREVKQKLGELYQYYTVLFCAIFKPIADRDYQNRVEDLNQSVEQIAGLTQSIEKLIKGGGSTQEVLAHSHHIDDIALAQAIQDTLLQGKGNKQKLQALLAALKERSKQADHEISVLDSAHLNYGMAQLSVYEDGKDIVKKMAAQGLNLAGRFVEASMTAAQRDMGRGNR